MNLVEQALGSRRLPSLNVFGAVSNASSLRPAPQAAPPMSAPEAPLFTNALREPSVMPAVLKAVENAHRVVEFSADRGPFAPLFTTIRENLKGEGRKEQIERLKEGAQDLLENDFGLVADFAELAPSMTKAKQRHIAALLIAAASDVTTEERFLRAARRMINKHVKGMTR